MSYVKGSIVFNNNISQDKQKKVIQELITSDEFDIHIRQEWIFIGRKSGYCKQDITDFLKKHKDKIRDFCLEGNEEVDGEHWRIRKIDNCFIEEIGHVEYEATNVLVN